MNDNSQSQIMNMAIFYYAQALYSQFGSLGIDKSKEIADAASRYSLETPLWLVGSTKQFDLPYIGKQSGVYCIAAMSAFLVWTQCHLQNIGLVNPTPMLAACRDALNLWYLETGNQPAWKKESEA